MIHIPLPNERRNRKSTLPILINFPNPSFPLLLLLQAHQASASNLDALTLQDIKTYKILYHLQLFLQAVSATNIPSLPFHPFFLSLNKYLLTINCIRALNMSWGKHHMESPKGLFSKSLRLHRGTKTLKSV